MVIITEHAYERAKDRLSLNRKSFENLASKALESGKKHKELKSHLKKYVDKLYLSYKNANNIKMYGHVIYLFRNNVLLTVYQLPSNLIKYINL